MTKTEQQHIGMGADPLSAGWADTPTTTATAPAPISVQKNQAKKTSSGAAGGGGGGGGDPLAFTTENKTAKKVDKAKTTASTTTTPSALPKSATPSTVPPPQSSHSKAQKNKPAQGINEKDPVSSSYSYINTLPRSVRWRVRLSLLEPPAPPSSDEDAAIMNQVEQYNATKILTQRERYDELAKRHYWHTSPMAIIHNEKEPSPPPPKEKPQRPKMSRRNSTGRLEALAGVFSDMMGDDSNNNNNDTTEEEEEKLLQQEQEEEEEEEIDPLSAMLMDKEQKETLERQRDLEERRERAAASRMRFRSNWKPSMRWKENKKEDGAEVKVDSACKGSRWSEFYSTREVLNVIEKDLNRLPPDHHLCYHEWSQQNQPQNNNEDDPDDILLSGHKSMPNFGFNDQIADDAKKEEEQIQRSREERAELLSQILFVYAKEHPELGYRQGMHEILSYIFLAIERDLLNHGVAKSENLALAGINDVGEKNSSDGESKEKEENAKILDSAKIMHDAFTLFECVMSSLAPAYDAKTTQPDAAGQSSNDYYQSESPMEVMSRSIVSKIRHTAGDEELYRHITNMSVPPQLYCTRWVRLMFSREVLGQENVMTLWDAFFDLMTATSQSEEKGAAAASSTRLMNVLESTAASMIVLIRDKLLPINGQGGEEDNDYDPNDCINTLMNYPPLKDVSPLIDIIMSMMLQQQHLFQEDLKKRNQKARMEAAALPSEAALSASGAAQAAPAVADDDKPIILHRPPPRRRSLLGRALSSEFSGDDLHQDWPQQSGEQRLQRPQWLQGAIGSVGRIADKVVTGSAALLENVGEHITQEEKASKQTPLADPLLTPAGFDPLLQEPSTSSAVTEKTDNTSATRSGATAQSAATEKIDNTSSMRSGATATDVNAEKAVVEKISAQTNATTLAADTKVIAPTDKKASDAVVAATPDSTKKKEKSGTNVAIVNLSDIPKLNTDADSVSCAQLASTLDKNISILMEYFRKTIDPEGERESKTLPPASKDNIASPPNVPESVWEAMLGIDSVRVALLKKEEPKQENKSFPSA